MIIKDKLPTNTAAQGLSPTRQASEARFSRRQKAIFKHPSRWFRPHGLCPLSLSLSLLWLWPYAGQFPTCEPEVQSRGFTVTENLQFHQCHNTPRLLCCLSINLARNITVQKLIEISLKAAVQCESYNGTLYKSLGHMERSKFSVLRSHLHNFLHHWLLKPHHGRKPSSKLSKGQAITAIVAELAYGFLELLGWLQGDLQSLAQIACQGHHLRIIQEGVLVEVVVAKILATQLHQRPLRHQKCQRCRNEFVWKRSNYKTITVAVYNH